MTAEVKEATEEWLSIDEAGALIDRHPESIRVDAKKGLITLTKKDGIRGRMVRLDRFNLYIKRKHGTRCKTVTPESLAVWRDSRFSK